MTVMTESGVAGERNYAVYAKQMGDRWTVEIELVGVVGRIKEDDVFASSAEALKHGHTVARGFA